MTNITHRHLHRQLRHARQQLASTREALLVLQAQANPERAGSKQQASPPFQSIGAALFVEDQTLKITFVTQRFCDIFGLPAAPDTYLGQSRAQLLSQLYRSPSDAENAAQLMAKAQTSLQATTSKIYLHTGQELQWSYIPIVQAGQTVLHLWRFEDVVQQSTTYNRLQELSRLAEQSPFPTIRFGRDGQPRYANPAAAPILLALKQPEAQECQHLLRQTIETTLTKNSTQTLEQPLVGRCYLWVIEPIPQEAGANVYLADITERRHAEDELRRSQLFIARISDTVPDLIFVFDLTQQRLTYCNQQSQQLLGYTGDELLAMNRDQLVNLLAPADRQVLYQISEAELLRADGQTFASERKMLHRDGTFRWLRFVSTAFTRYPAGQVHQLISCAQDITKQREIQEELRHSRLFAERIAHTAPHLIHIYDLVERRTVYCNQHIYNILGYTENEILHTDSFLVDKLFPPAEAQRFVDYWQQVKQAADGDIVTVELQTTHRNGTGRWLRINTSPFERDAQGNIRLVIDTAEDITKWRVADEQRRSANRRLAEQNHLFRQVIDTTPYLVYLKDIKGNYLLANRATAELFGLSTAELIRTDHASLPITPADSIRYLNQDQYVIRSGQETAQETFTKPDGKILWYYSIKRPFELTDGTVQVLGIDSNITELKKTQLDLRAAKEAAEETANAKQSFLANMSHEIRTPMNGVLGLTSLLAKTSLTEQQRQYVDNIQHSAENLLVIINDILVMAQLGAHKIRPEITPFDLHDVLSASYQLLLPRVSEKGIQLELESPPPHVPTNVLGDPYRLRQILLNLLSNAVKFTDQGRVLLTCQPLDKGNGESWFEFTVSDTGIGIPAHHLHNVFEAFTQASSSTAREYGGSGLGLSISKGLVELLGGRITVESTLGKGSTFRFALPLPVAVAGLAEALLGEPESTLTPNYKSLGPCRVLLAEDNAVNQLLVQTILQNWGMQVSTAFTGPEALALFRQHPYDFVLMDIQMPGMDGVTTTRLLREHPDPARAATPVIALTAHAMQGEAERYQAAGLNGYVSKPFREEELFRAVKSVLRQRLLPAAPLTKPAPDPAPAPPLYDLSSIRRLAHGNEVFVKQLLKVFVQTTSSYVRELEDHLANQRWPALAAAAHRLKSSLDSLQVSSLHGIIRQLEALTDSSSQAAEITALVGQVREITGQVIEQLQAQVEAMP